MFFLITNVYNGQLVQYFGFSGSECDRTCILYIPMFKNISLFYSPVPQKRLCKIQFFHSSPRLEFRKWSPIAALELNQIMLSSQGYKGNYEHWNEDVFTIILVYILTQKNLYINFCLNYNKWREISMKI